MRMAVTGPEGAVLRTGGDFRRRPKLAPKLAPDRVIQGRIRPYGGRG